MVWVDVARGIGIIAVLYGHALSGDSYRHLLYAFHMPLFFFLSGVVLNLRKYPHFFPFLKRNVMTVLLPYLLFALLSYAIWFFARTNYPPLPDILQHAINIAYANSNGLFFNVVLWFLPCLFITKLIFWIIAKFSLHTKFLIASLIIISIAGYIFSLSFPGIKLPFGIETAITAVVFFGAGYIWRLHGQKIHALFQKYIWQALILFFIISVVAASVNFDLYGYQIDMRLNRYSNYFLFYIAAFSGIFATIAASMYIGSNRLLQYIGNKSMVLFVWHIIAFTYFTQYLRVFVNPQTLDAIRNTYLAPLITVAAIIVILLTFYLYQKITYVLLIRQKNYNN